MPRYAVAIDLQKFELRQARVQNLSTAPTSPVVGQIYFNTVTGYFSFWDGTVWSTVKGLAGGDLAGTYPNPSIGAGVITDSKVAAGAAIQLSKLAVDPLARANHTGTQLASTVSNFDTQVRTSRLDQMAAPTATVSFNAQQLSNLLDPINPQDGATKAYVDASSLGLDVKLSVRAATTANITLSGVQTLDAVSLAVGDRVLVKAQTTATNNGIWIVATTAWTRATDSDTSAKVSPGMFAFVEEGTTNADSGWILTTDGPITLGTTPLVYTQFTGTGQINAGAGLTKTGNTIDVIGTSNRITAFADNIDIAATYVGQTSITTLGTITTGTWTGTTIAVANGGTGATTPAAARANLAAAGKVVLPIVGGSTSEVLTHNLNTRAVVVQIYETSSPYGQVEFQVDHTTVNTITVTSDSTLVAATWEAVILG